MRFTAALIVVLSFVAVASAGTLRNDKEIGHFSVEKGFKCTGGFDMSKHGGCKKCEGGSKEEFSVGTSDLDLVDAIASDLRTSLSLDDLVPDTHDLVSANIMDEMTEVDYSHVEDGFEKTMEVGGTAKMEWGCKVTFSKTGGKFSKKVECGVKGEAAMGKKPNDDDEPDMMED